MTNIALIIPYYGSFPNYFSLYVNSLAKNPNIHVYMFTDCFYDGFIPDNLHMVESNIEHFKSLVKSKLDVDAKINRGYKLCDFKPAYGVIFEDYITEYEYWAMGDIDVIYGDVLNNLPDGWETYDVISMVPEWISGSFCIFKNTNKVNYLFSLSNNWENVFSAENNFAFDECNYLYEELRQGKNILDIDDLESFTFIVKREAEKGLLKIWFDENLIKEKIFRNLDHVRMLNGSLYKVNGQEIVYYHLVSEKITDRFVIPKWGVIPDEYFITHHGLFLPEEFWYKKISFFRIFIFLRSLFLDIKQLFKRVFNKCKSCCIKKI
ncbi:DUF6625 family protein [Neptuniibacter sp. 1_MG-2023]|uniref:DUF6625 family protein n=1 Tax=Neptuniibacter sp. 1_MG-2023 TaxID=3062662 RepID=UPI0026E155A7|nr:DUF6625 family protein [Neptuniibacter sp. 1_MG-2023]MDO6592925.1 hypothetical protein [Neptuniibacter sp. 1_MG-2023]